MRSIFYTPAQPQRSSRLEGRRHTRQESRGESVSLRSARLSGGDLHSVRATSAGHIETDAHEPIGLSAARLRSQFFFFCLRVHPGRLATFCRPYLNGTRCSGSRGRNIKAAAAAVAPQKRRSETTDRPTQKKNKKSASAREARSQRGDIFEGRSCSCVWRQFSRKCHHGTGCCDCKHAIPIRR